MTTPPARPRPSGVREVLLYNWPLYAAGAATVAAARASAARLPVASGSQDTVFAVFAAHELRHRAHLKALFDEIARVLRPGGTLVLVEHLRNAAATVVYGPGAWHFRPAPSGCGWPPARGWSTRPSTGSPGWSPPSPSTGSPREPPARRAAHGGRPVAPGGPRAGRPGLFHALLPRIVVRPADLAGSSLLTRQVGYAHLFLIGLTCVLLGLLPLPLTRDLRAGTPLGTTVLAGQTLFWGIRWLFEFAYFYFSPRLWRGDRLRTAAHLALSVLWSWVTAVFARALALTARGG